jgi:hypothetical protein
MIKKDRRFTYLPLMTNLNPGLYLKDNQDWVHSCMVIYDPTKGKRGLADPEPASGSFQIFWPINPWSALDA